MGGVEGGGGWGCILSVRTTTHFHPCFYSLQGFFLNFSLCHNVPSFVLFSNFDTLGNVNVKSETGETSLL